MGARRRDGNIVLRRRSCLPILSLLFFCLIFFLSVSLSAEKASSVAIGVFTEEEEEQQQQQQQQQQQTLRQTSPGGALVNKREEVGVSAAEVILKTGRSKTENDEPSRNQQATASSSAAADSQVRGASKTILSLPSVLKWGHQELFVPSQKALTIVNTLNDTELRISQLYSSNPNFHVVGFRETKLPPAGMLAAHVIFLPMDMALIEGFLVAQTSIGAVSFVMQGVGVAPTYGLLDAITIQQPPRCPLDQPFQPAIALQVSKNVGMFSAPVDGEVARKEEWTVITVYPVQVSLIGESKLMFPDTPVGQKQVHWLKVTNPSDRPVSVELFVNSVVEKTSEYQDVIQCDTYSSSGSRRCDDIKCPKSSQSVDSVFIVPGGIEKVILQPNSTDAIGPVIFHPRERHAVWRSNLIVLNNLTGIEWMAIEGRGTSPMLRFLDGKDDVCTLEVQVNRSLLSSFSKWTLREQIDTLLDDNSAREVCYQRTSKEFVARNVGNSPLQVESLMLSGSHGFRMDPFHGFHLAPGESAKLLVSYYPDIGNSQSHEGELQLVTPSGMFSVTLRAHIPENMLYFCRRAQLLSTVKRVFLQVCLVALFVVLLVFGKMLKQEAVRPDEKEWPLAGKSLQLPGIGNNHYQDDGKTNTQKKPSIYVSIDFDCTQNEEKQSNSLVCFTKALNTVLSALSHINYLCNSHLKIKIWAVKDMVAVIIKRNDKNDIIDSMMLEKNGNVSGAPGKRTSQTRVSSPPAPRISLPRKGKAKVSLLPLEKIEATSSGSEKEKDKAVKRKRRKNGVCIPLDMDNSSDGSCHSPLSTPSSPLKQSASCRPVSPLVKGTNTTGQANMEVKGTNSTGLDSMELVSNRVRSGSKEVVRSDPVRNKGVPEISEPGVLAARHGRDTINPEGALRIKTTKSTIAKHEALNPLSKEQKAKSSKARVDLASPTFATKSNSSKLKSQAVERHLVQNVMRTNDSRSTEGGSVWTLLSAPNLVSISAVAPHARAPGTPLISTTAADAMRVIQDPDFNRQFGDGNQGTEPRGTSLSTVVAAAAVKAGAGSTSPLATTSSSTSDHSMILYDIWGDHFVEIGRNLLPEEDPTTKIPFFSGPQAPAFSVFSSTDPFHVQQQTD